MNENYRPLTPTEVEKLQNQGCTAADWNKVKVSPKFVPENVKNVQFSGIVNIGDNSGIVEFEGGLQRNCGIYNASIHNCTIGNQVYLSQICNYIANYDIDDHVILENIESCLVDGETTFGNGIKV